jgi:hypothetical protein
MNRMNPGRLMLKAPPPSEEKAAAIIQAHWRGFGVRRTKPLEQLQLIYQVRQDLKAHMKGIIFVYSLNQFAVFSGFGRVFRNRSKLKI